MLTVVINIDIMQLTTIKSGWSDIGSKDVEKYLAIVIMEGMIISV